MSNWISVKKYLPGLDSNWCIVITKNKDNSYFSFMAIYSHSSGKWDFFDDDKGYDNSMEIIFWQYLPQPPKETE